METYKITYNVKKKDDGYECVRSVNKTLPEFLWPTFASMTNKLEKVVLDEAKKTKKSFKLEVIFKI